MKVLASCWPMLPFYHDIHLVSLKKSWEQSNPWHLMERLECWQRMGARGLAPPTRRAEPWGQKRETDKGTFDVVFSIKSSWNSPKPDYHNKIT